MAILEQSLAKAMAVLSPDYEPPPPATLDDVVLLLREILEEVKSLHRDVEP